MDEKGDNKVIVITKEDLAARKDTTRTARDIFFDQVRSKAVSNMNNAANLADFMRFHFAALVSTNEMSGWMLDDSPELSVEEVMMEHEGKDKLEMYDKEAKLVEEMRNIIEQDGKEAEDNKFKLCVARVRERGFITYRVLAKFPTGQMPDDTVLPKPKDQQDNYLYYRPQEACVRHACDQIYRKQEHADGDRAIVVFETDFINFMDAYRSVASNAGGSGKSEFILDRNPNGETITQDPYKYVIAGVHGVYSNEWDRVRISDFWNREK